MICQYSYTHGSTSKIKLIKNNIYKSNPHIIGAAERVTAILFFVLDHFFKLLVNRLDLLELCGCDLCVMCFAFLWTHKNFFALFLGLFTTANYKITTKRKKRLRCEAS